DPSTVPAWQAKAFAIAARRRRGGLPGPAAAVRVRHPAVAVDTDRAAGHTDAGRALAVDATGAAGAAQAPGVLLQRAVLVDAQDHAVRRRRVVADRADVDRAVVRGGHVLRRVDVGRRRLAA